MNSVRSRQLAWGMTEYHYHLYLSNDNRRVNLFLAFIQNNFNMTLTSVVRFDQIYILQHDLKRQLLGKI